MNADEILKRMEVGRQERQKLFQAKINEVYEGVPPYTEEELMKTTTKWMINALMAHKSKIQSLILKQIKDPNE